MKDPSGDAAPRARSWSGESRARIPRAISSAISCCRVTTSGAGREKVLDHRFSFVPGSIRAYAQYLLGQEHLNMRTPESIRRSIGDLDRSIAIDSTFGPAWATLALANAMGVFYSAIPSDSARAATTRATQRALALDPTLGDALIARGLIRFLVDWDFTAAAEDFRHGMAGNPTTLAQAMTDEFFEAARSTERC